LDYFLFFFLIFFGFRGFGRLGRGRSSSVFYAAAQAETSSGLGTTITKRRLRSQSLFTGRNTTLAPFLALRLVFAVCSFDLVTSDTFRVDRSELFPCCDGGWLPE
jgi:hypothetical protein